LQSNKPRKALAEGNKEVTGITLERLWIEVQALKRNKVDNVELQRLMKNNKGDLTDDRGSLNP
jgi:hypothetical protein